MGDTVDILIEGWVRDRVSSVRETTDQTLKGFETWTLTGTTEEEKSYVLAARAVRDAVLAKIGRRPKVDYWRKVAAEALGLKRLTAKRWKAVLDAGISAGLLRIDEEALSYPHLVGIPDPEPEADPTPEIKEVAVDTHPVSSRLPSDWVPPTIEPCGHRNWPSDGDQEEARSESFCCAAQRSATLRYRKLNPGMDDAIAPLSVDWRVRGLTDPVPMGLRRTSERDQGSGWPGLCCDEDSGLYIGGVGNDCRRYHTGSARCPAHTSKKT